MPDVTLSAGALSYEDSGGDGPVVVMVGGLAMDALMWRKVVAEPWPAHRCLVLTLPLGSHRQPMKPDSDLFDAWARPPGGGVPQVARPA